MKQLYLIILGFIFFSCGGAIQNRENEYVVKNEYDKFEDINKNIMEQNILDGGYSGIGSISVSSLNIEQYITKKTDTTYYLKLICINNNWLFIQKENSMTMLIDGEKVSLSNNEVFSNTIDVTNKIYCREYAYYNVDKDLIIKIANAKKIEIKITGKEIYVERKFNKSNFDNYKRFIKEFIQK